MLESTWKQCLDHFESDIPLSQFETWLRPLQPQTKEGELCLLAPNQYVRDHVDEHYSDYIRRTLTTVGGRPPTRLTIAVGSLSRTSHVNAERPDDGPRRAVIGLKSKFTFENFVEGKSNQLASAIARQVADDPGNAYNPFLIYGGVGLGKTHLMHAIGGVVAKRSTARVAYLTAMSFVRDMVSSIRHRRMDEFSQYYRSLDTLLIDDIQFFAQKEKSQEEFFLAFDDLMHSNHQIVLTCDRYPKEVDGLPERLTSRFGSGVSFAIEPPDLETRAAILMSKASASDCDLPYEVAMDIADQLKSNVRELEGALRRVIASSEISGKPITTAYCREVLGDLFAIQDRLVSIEAIQKRITDYFKLRASDLTSKRRHRSIVRPRQIAMALARELTNHSLPEIGSAFGGRDHTTVLHACRKVEELRKTDNSFDVDYQNLLRHLYT